MPDQAILYREIVSKLTRHAENIHFWGINLDNFWFFNKGSEKDLPYFLDKWTLL